MSDSESTWESLFHAGEREIQERLGVRDELERRAPRVIRDFFPEQHRRFYEGLPFLVVAARDEVERPWATILAGPPGFVHSPDVRTLTIDSAIGRGDALAGAVQRGSELGILGIDLARRRRNRVNGRVALASSSSIEIEVDQTFGNCPRFIHPRKWKVADVIGSSPGTPRLHEALSHTHRSWIMNSETFFIASGHRGDREAPSGGSSGMDASHRGGPPGFVAIEDERILLFPDYVGNDHFNTLGNLMLDPRAGLLFVDFEGGSLLQLTGRATVEWGRPDQARFPDAMRLVRFEIDGIVEQRAVLPIRWEREEREERNR